MPFVAVVGGIQFEFRVSASAVFLLAPPRLLTRWSSATMKVCVAALGRRALGHRHRPVVRGRRAPRRPSTVSAKRTSWSRNRQQLSFVTYPKKLTTGHGPVRLPHRG
ncbi:hypothetical protein OPT61_g1835 [Boeremia exigua]|uniref:Uncharacterized protein n=1 Tax=Boeremia exigua TaxID=749465 RepID=A0ACC2IP38_9PLEO|nr:hypothetical protein OPT61_g1835 [Boeremia exigua]